MIMYSRKRQRIVVTALTPALLVFVLLTIALVHFQPLYRIDEANLPRFADNTILKPEHLGAITRFRSGFGKSVTSGDDTCSNMQQHLLPPATAGFFDTNAVPPKNLDPISNIAVYSPVEGRIVSITPSSNNLGSTVKIQAKDRKAYTFTVQQIYPLDEIARNTKVFAGQRIGSKTPQQSIIVEVDAQTIFSGRVLVPFTSLLTDEAFSKNFDERVEGGRSTFVITKKTRAADALTCNGNTFVYPNFGNVSSGLTERNKKDIVQLPPVIQ